MSRRAWAPMAPAPSMRTRSSAGSSPAATRRSPLVQFSTAGAGSVATSSIRPHAPALKRGCAACAARFVMIDDAGHGLRPLYPLWESQIYVLDRLGDLERQRWDTHPDGLLLNVLKARQLRHLHPS